jgi:hypothetical protein
MVGFRASSTDYRDLLSLLKIQGVIGTDVLLTFHDNAGRSEPDVVLVELHLFHPDA